MKFAHNITILTYKTLEELDRELQGLASIVAVNPRNEGPVILEWNDYRNSAEDSYEEGTVRAIRQAENTKLLREYLKGRR